MRNSKEVNMLEISIDYMKLDDGRVILGD